MRAPAEPAGDWQEWRPVSMVASAGLGLALLTVLVGLAAGPGYRFGLWPLGTAFAVIRWATLAAAIAVVISLIGMILARPHGPRRGFYRALAGFLVALATVAVPLSYVARGVPPIHDISTDTEEPPQFVAILPLRAGAPNPAAYGGTTIAGQQHEAYPEIAPAMLDLPVDAAFARALDVARDMGWQIVASEPREGRIEAVAHTLWFGFKDDVVIRVRPTETGSRVDIRSTSRVGVGDLGTNAARVLTYLRELENRATAPPV